MPPSMAVYRHTSNFLAAEEKMSLQDIAHASLARINVRATPDAMKCSRATVSVLVPSNKSLVLAQ